MSHMHEKSISLSVEMYLVTIFRLTNESDSASTRDIAELLGVSLPSVTGQLKNLDDKGYVNYEWREGARLSERGRRIALSVLRKNRLIKTFLYTNMKYALYELFDEACLMEHMVSDRFVDALEDMLGNPRFDPHGMAIPDRAGNVQGYEGVYLRGLTHPCDFEVLRISETDNDVVRNFEQLGLVPRAQVTCSAVEPEAFTLQIGEKEVMLPRELGRHLTVQMREK